MPILSSIMKTLFPTRHLVKELHTRMEIHMSRVTETLLAINDQLDKAAKEITSKIAELETRDYLTDEDKSILSHIKAGAQTLDDIVPDDVAEEAEKEQEAEDQEGEAADPVGDDDADQFEDADADRDDEDDSDEEEVTQP